MSRLGGAAAVAPLVADMSSEVKILPLPPHFVSQYLQIFFFLYYEFFFV